MRLVNENVSTFRPLEKDANNLTTTKASLLIIAIVRPHYVTQPLAFMDILVLSPL